MDVKKFRENCQQMVDYVANYLESLPLHSITPSLPPGYLKSTFPSTPPRCGDSFKKIMEDLEKHILPGLIHWQHPGFYGYNPFTTSFTSIIASMLIDTFAHMGFNWNISPCGSELETIVCDWYGKMIGLSDSFLFYGVRSTGAGIVQKSTSECIFISMVSARRLFLRRLSQRNPSISNAALLSSLVCYCSKEANKYVKKVATLALVNVRILETDENHIVRGKTLEKALENDKRIGLIPFFVNITLGTSSCGACDPIKEIGIVCEKYDVWLNVEAGYGGTALICPEYRHLLEGIEYASSFISSPAQWMLVHLDCAILYVKDLSKIRDSVCFDRTTFGYSFAERDWGYPCKIELRILKLFFVIYKYGVEGLQKHVRNRIHLAKLFEDCVKKDERFELWPSQLGIVCFRLKASDSTNQMLNVLINASGKLFLTPCRLDEKYVIRFVICSEYANEDHIKSAWEQICMQTKNIKVEDWEELKKGSSEMLVEFEKCSSKNALHDFY